MIPYPTSPFGRAHFYQARIYTWRWHSIIGNLHSCIYDCMTAVSLMSPPHNGLDTPWPKFMLNSLRYLCTFPRRKDRRFSTSSPYTRSESLSEISTWQPHTLTFVGTWRRAASLAAGSSSSNAEGTHTSYFWNERGVNGECSQPAFGHQACGCSTDPVCGAGFQLVVVDSLDSAIWTIRTVLPCVWDIHGLKLASCGDGYLERWTKESDGVSR